MKGDRIRSDMDVVVVAAAVLVAYSCPPHGSGSDGRTVGPAIYIHKVSFMEGAICGAGRK